MPVLLRALLILVVLSSAIVMMICLYRRARPLRGAHFICPHCASVHMPGRLIVAISPARKDSRLLQCPVCKKAGYMEPVWDAR